MGRGSFLILATCGLILFASTAEGQFGGRGGGGRGGGGRGRDTAASDPTRGMKPLPPQVVLTPHGGEFLQTDTIQYEVVYMPLQTRVYLFDKKLKPLTARDARVQMSLTLPAESSPRRIAFRYAAVPPRASEQDFVFAQFDLRQLQDREVPITFEFSGLPDRKSPKVSFSPVFSAEKIRPFAARVLLTAADRDGVMRQRVCPVSGQMLGTRGPIVKLYLGDFPLYLSGEDCIAAVQASPERYLSRPAAARPAPPVR